MTALEKAPELDVRFGCRAELIVDPEDISFEDLPGPSVLIRVKIRNGGEARSRPTLMRLESAPLGAFVPWRSLALLRVPALEPGESRELTTQAPRPRPTPLGNFDRVPPRSLLAAVSSPDEPSPRPDARRMTAFMIDLLRRGGSVRRSSGSGGDGSVLLAPDLMDLLGRGQPHWAGNINVFVGSRAVERHMAKALRIYPGRPNLAMFIVGGMGRSDAYAFEIVGLSRDWKAGLCDLTNRRTLLVGASDQFIEESQWVETPGPLMVMLVTHPPEGCKEGNVEIHVTRRSCQKTAVVEFNLDPSAQGTGCYVA